MSDILQPKHEPTLKYKNTDPKQVIEVFSSYKQNPHPLNSEHKPSGLPVTTLLKSQTFLYKNYFYSFWVKFFINYD